jgi:hypothetical protein
MASFNGIGTMFLWLLRYLAGRIVCGNRMVCDSVFASGATTLGSDIGNWTTTHGRRRSWNSQLQFEFAISSFEQRAARLEANF